MKTTIIFLKKLATLCCFLMVLFLNSRSYGQIIYTNIPDATPNATYPLDLNNDNIIDFLIQFDLVDKVVCKPLNNNAYSGNVVGAVHLPWALSASNSICDSLATWYGANNPGTMAWGTNMGYWVGETNKYLALKLIVGSNTYYGWARLDFESTSTSFTIKDYAYESTANACIQTRRSNQGIDENSNKDFFSILPNPLISSTTIHPIRNLQNATLTILNSYGQTLKQVKNISGNSVFLSRDNLASGLYFIRLTEENKTLAVKKLIIAD